MPIPYIMNFNIHPETHTSGGKLKCDYVLPPRLKAGDTLMLQATWKAGSVPPPEHLFGYAMISPEMSPDVEHPQAGASPFVTAEGHPVCFTRFQPVLPTVAHGNVYQFPEWTYAGGILGRFELTFVCETPGANTPDAPSGLQWSEDPEFDTEG